MIDSLLYTLCSLKTADILEIFSNVEMHIVTGYLLVKVVALMGIHHKLGCAWRVYCHRKSALLLIRHLP